MQAFAGIPDQRGQTFLDIQMHIFQFSTPDEFATKYFPPYLIQASADCSKILRGYDSCRRKHSRMSKRTFNVVFRESAVKTYRRCVALYQFRNRFAESSGPCCLIRLGSRLVIYENCHKFVQNRGSACKRGHSCISWAARRLRPRVPIDEYKQKPEQSSGPSALIVGVTVKDQPRMLPHSVKPNTFPILFRYTELGPVRCQESGRVDRVIRYAMGVDLDKMLELAGIGRGDPSGDLVFRGHEASVDAVLVLEPVRHHFKL